MPDSCMNVFPSLEDLQLSSLPGYLQPEIVHLKGMSIGSDPHRSGKDTLGYVNYLCFLLLQCLPPACALRIKVGLLP